MDREKTIEGMQILQTWCAVNPKYGMGLSVEDCEKAVGWIDGALALLKAQEPRVMTMEEAQTLERDTVIWFEHEESKEVRPRIINYVYNDGIVFTDGGEWRFLEDDYGKRWRCWTSRPTDKQREATPWDQHSVTNSGTGK